MTAISSVVVFLLTYWIATDALDGQIRAGIDTELGNLLTDWQPGHAEDLARELDTILRNPSGTAFYYYLAGKDGKKLAGNLSGMAPVSGWQDKDFGGPSSTLPGAAADVDDDHRLIALGRLLADGSFLLVGDDSYRILSAQEAIIKAFAWASAVSAALAIVLGLLVSQRFLRQIDTINATSNAIADGQLKERIPVRGTADEIDRLAANINTMLDRNQKLLESLKHISTDVAHDLRTPLARLQRNLEEARADPGNSARTASRLDEAAAEIAGLLSTFAAILRIAQVESGSRKSGFKPVDLLSLVRRITEVYGPVAEDGGKSLTAELRPVPPFSGDEELLAQMFVNLIENAITHTPPGTPIGVSLSTGGRGTVAEIGDRGPGIPEADRAKVFQRFYRLDGSRSTPGNGLGLTLVSAIADLHDLELSLSDNHPGLKVTVRFPA